MCILMAISKLPLQTCKSCSATWAPAPVMLQNSLILSSSMFTLLRDEYCFKGCGHPASRIGPPRLSKPSRWASEALCHQLVKSLASNQSHVKIWSRLFWFLSFKIREMFVKWINTRENNWMKGKWNVDYYIFRKDAANSNALNTFDAFLAQTVAPLQHEFVFSGSIFKINMIKTYT